MAGSDKDVVPLLSNAHPRPSGDNRDSQFQTFISRSQSASISIPMNSIESYESIANLGHTGSLQHERTQFIQMSGPLYISREPENSYHQGADQGHEQVEPKLENFPSFNEVEKNVSSDDNNAGRNEHLQRSGQLGMCSDPYCTICPTNYNFNAVQPNYSKPSGIFDAKLHNAFCGDAKDGARRFMSLLRSYVPGVMNPHAKVVQQWNRFFVISCLVAIFEDPLFSFLFSVQKDKKCMVINWPMTTTLVVLRSITDLIYLLNMLLQFRLAYIAPESRVVGAGELVDHPKKIAINYLRGYFVIDFFAILPVPQIVIFLVLPAVLARAYIYRNLLYAALLLQYIPRLYRFLTLVAGQSPSGFIFESAWMNFIINLLMFVLSGHIVGSFWYLFGLQRVNQCLQGACSSSVIENCLEFIACESGSINHDSEPGWTNWISNGNATACFSVDGFTYGIYGKAVDLAAEKNIIGRYIYSLFWGFQQICALAGNQTPSYSVSEVLFTMAIIGLGLLLFALLVGNMQNFLQALGRRRLEMSLRRRDVEQWMSHRRLPQELRRRVREAERYNWACTRGVNEEILYENFPEDLQRDIRRHLFKFIKKVRIFALMEDPILDAISERLRQKAYIKESRVFCPGGLIDKMVFIVRGKMESIGEDGIRVPLVEGDACGEELLTWCLEHSSVNGDGKRIRIPGKGLLSHRTVRCLTNVEAFSLQAADLQEVTSLFSRFLCNPRVQGAIRYESPYWRCIAATRIQAAWRYRKRRLSSHLSG